MALPQTQRYIDYKNEHQIMQAAQRVIVVKDKLNTVKSDIIAIYNAVNADPNADADLKTLANQANNFVTNAAYTDFITFVTNSLE